MSPPRIFDNLEGADPEEARLLCRAAKRIRSSPWWTVVDDHPASPEPVSGEIPRPSDDYFGALP